MKRTCILCDFDGTITKTDGLYGFFTKYASTDWLEVERLWEEGKISSKECLIREFECIENLNEELITNYIKTIEIDEYFKEFLNFTREKNIDLYVLSDGADYFINKTLQNYDIKGIEIISNHFEFKNNKFMMTFPNDNPKCKKNAGTCKCSAVERMKNKYKTVIYIGDGTSDYCVCDKAHILFAKSKLITYSKKNKIEHKEFTTFKDIIEVLSSK